MSNIVSIINGEALATSMTIADGTNVQHKNVLELVRTNLNDFEEFGRVAFQTLPFETAGGTQQRDVALLNERQATLLMTYMRNSEIVKEFKKRLVKAFYEMAAGQTPKSFSEALRLAADQAERLEQQSRELEEARPKVEFHDRVAQSEEAITVGEAAKILGTGRRRLFAFLRKAGWVTRKNEPYQSKIEQGYLDVKLGSWEHPDHGLQQAVTTLVTGKGLAKLQKIYSKDDIAA
ncbi:phage regulatory protein/antirepressor Ant [uncultured Zhongshania sp.]|uniref:phage regulatory protein/antirepressor Ant n=1 Tax=uncultured Zhongshania sp. TaxID=1642288 RepID=UPI0030DAB11C